MKRLLAFLAPLCALAVPANAAITQIVGTGTGGNIGGTANTSVSSIVLTTNVTVPANNFIAVGMSLRSVAGTATGCTDDASNTYTVINMTGQANADSALAYSNNANALTSGLHITCTLSAGMNASSFALAFSGVKSSSPKDPASPAPTGGSGTTFSAGTTGTLAFPGTTELLIGNIGFGTSGTVTEASGFTSGGSNTTFQPDHIGFQIVTSNAATSYAPTTGTSSTYTGILAAFEQDTGGVTPTNRLLMRGAP